MSITPHGFTFWAVSCVAGIVIVGSATSADACYPVVTLSQVDQALAAAPLKGARLADASVLRGNLAEAVKRNDQRSAQTIETQVMALMGYVEGRPASRGGCARTWEKAD